MQQMAPLFIVITLSFMGYITAKITAFLLEDDIED